MNDRLRFRAFHKPTKKLFDVYCFTATEVFENTLDGVGTSPTNPAKMEDCILLQCTGMKDKNGELIYEGDIVKLDSEQSDMHIAKVIYRNGCFGLSAKKWASPFNFLQPRRWKIIGNIHDNPKLLEVKK